jgi:sugar phosphate isomerase/epimerase
MKINNALHSFKRGSRMETTRRRFVQALSLAAVSGAFANDRKAERLPIAFSTLGCPQWSLGKILEFAQSHGFAAIELRGLQGNMDLPSSPLFAPDQMGATQRLIAASGIKIACVSSSARMGEEDPGKRSKELGDGRRFIDLAATLGAPYVRVFGDGVGKGTAPGAELKEKVAAGLHDLGEYAAPKNVTVIIESHDNFTASATLSDVLEQAKSDNVALLWDAHHTFATAGEDPEFTVKQLGRWIRHTHLKDSVGSGENRKYVLTGRGSVPIQRQIGALRSIGYRGYFCFEWEKVWHPDLADPEIAIADYAQVVRGYFANSPQH